jgi:hypothetical protein
MRISPDQDPGVRPSTKGPTLPMIVEYSDKPLTPGPSPIGERGAEGGVRGLVSIEENHKKCHYNLQTSIRLVSAFRNFI